MWHTAVFKLLTFNKDYTKIMTSQHRLNLFNFVFLWNSLHLLVYFCTEGSAWVFAYPQQKSEQFRSGEINLSTLRPPPHGGRKYSAQAPHHLLCSAPIQFWLSDRQTTSHNTLLRERRYQVKQGLPSTKSSSNYSSAASHPFISIRSARFNRFNYQYFADSSWGLRLVCRRKI